jgi:hypothetical protein
MIERKVYSHLDVTLILKIPNLIEKLRFLRRRLNQNNNKASQTPKNAHRTGGEPKRRVTDYNKIHTEDHLANVKGSLSPLTVLTANAPTNTVRTLG